MPEKTKIITGMVEIIARGMIEVMTEKTEIFTRITKMIGIIVVMT